MRKWSAAALNGGPVFMQSEFTIRERVLARLLAYVRSGTQSDDATALHPSTPRQREFAGRLAAEMSALGIAGVRISEFAYVFGELAATPGLENVPALGLIAHMDTSPDAPGEGVNPQVIEYAGGVVELGNSGRRLDPALFPELNRLVGQTLVTTDGATLLGADDKAGIAEILTAAEVLLAENRPHGRICFGFTPDEEIGEGALNFDVADFGAAYAYTVDGGAAGQIEFRNFNAATAVFSIRGRSVHPGSAKDVMINAQKIAFALDGMLPPEEVPERTEDTQGFYHLLRSSGSVGEAQLTYLLRDHDAASFERRKQTVRRIARELNARWGEGTVALEIKDQYRNMEEVIRRHPFLIELAEAAARRVGLTPSSPPVRGGTDGATLSFKGLPCPNLGTGGYNFHGECEFASVPEMTATVEMLLALIDGFSRRGTPPGA